jgi:hypothetical protein
MSDNVYYYPERFGLTPVGEIQFSEPNYSFDFGVLWLHDDGSYYYGQDMGCSCPAPFERVSGLDDLEGPFTYLQAIEFITELKPDEYADQYEIERVASDKVDLIGKLIK